MLISIIIPIYKVEEYIERCIDSVLNQTYRELEVILVDDCSPDRSMDLARKRIESSKQSTDISFIYLKHKQNRGLSAARNTGINVATGEYVYFLDSDDEILHDTIAILYHTAIKYNYPEMVVGSIEVKGQRSGMQNRILHDGYYEGNDIIRHLYVQGLPYMMAWNKLVKLNIIKQNNLFFIEGIIHEDNPWSFFTANKLKTMAITSYVSYIYYLRSDSIMAVLNSQQKTKRYTSLITIIKEYDKGFANDQLICDKQNKQYYNRLKYDTAYEIIHDTNLSITYRLKCMQEIIKCKWNIDFLYLFTQLEVKIGILNILKLLKIKPLIRLIK